MTRTGMASVDEDVLVRIILPKVALQSRRSESLLVGVVGVVRRTGERSEREDGGWRMEDGGWEGGKGAQGHERHDDSRQMVDAIESCCGD